MVRFSVLEPWTDPRGGEIERVRIDNGILALEVISLGGIIRSLWAPDKQGERANIVLGCDNAADYLNQNAYLGAVVGRFANRIAGGKLAYKNKKYHLDINQAPNCLHGGALGFHQKNWNLGLLPDGVRLSLASPDGEMGFPGNCTVQLDYRLAGNNLFVEIFASVDKPCPVSLTQHSYFNLDGTNSNHQHRLQIDATRYLPIDAAGIPTGIADVKDSAFDLTKETKLGDRLQAPALLATQGYDHCFLMDNPDGSLHRVGCLSSPQTGRAMTVFTNQPSVQLYCANFLAGTVGRNQQSLQQHQGICIEPQMLPDSPNQPATLGENAWLVPGKVYHHISRYQFDIDG